MQILRKVLTSRDIPKDLVLLLVISGLYYLSIALSNTFVNVFLWKHTKSFFDIGLYNLMIVVFQPLTFLLAGRWAKKMDRVVVLRIGIMALAFFFISVLVFGAHTQKFLLLFGALQGIGFGFFWCAFNVLTFEITEPNTRDFFNGFQGLLSSLAGIIGPVFAGWIITSMKNYRGYQWIFGLSLFLFAMAILTSWFLKNRPAKGHPAFGRIIMERKHNLNWKAVLNAHFVQGLREGTFFFIIGIWVFLTTNSEFALGKFSLIQSGLMFVAYYLVSKQVKQKYRRTAILTGGLFMSLAVFLLLFNLTFGILIVYAVVVALAYPLLTVPFTSLTFDTIGKGWKAREMRIEYIVVRELYYNVGRILSILAFLTVVMAFKNNSEGIRLFMVVIGAGHLAIYFCIYGKPFFQPTNDNAIDDDHAPQFRDGERGSTV